MKLVRIDLQKHYVPHVEFEDLEETDEKDDIRIVDLDENNFTQIRELQQKHISKSLKDAQLV